MPQTAYYRDRDGTFVPTLNRADRFASTLPDPVSIGSATKVQARARSSCGDDTTPMEAQRQKTSRESARLDRRKREYAILQDALRRRLPVSMIPSLLSGVDGGCTSIDCLEEVEGEMECSCVHDPHLPYPPHSLSSPSSSLSPSSTSSSDIDLEADLARQQYQQRYTPTNSTSGPPPPAIPTTPIVDWIPGRDGKRLDLDDSFLRRSYKRRRSWGGSLSSSSSSASVPMPLAGKAQPDHRRLVPGEFYVHRWGHRERRGN